MRHKLIIVLSLVLLLGLAGCGAKERNFNIANYLTIEESGYDGYGTINVSFDYDKLYSHYVDSFKKKNITVDNLKETIQVTVLNEENISNNQSVNIAITTNPEVVSIEAVINDTLNLTVSHTVTNLTPLTPYNPFDDLKIEPSGISPNGTLNAYIEHYGKEASWYWPLLVESDNTTVANGDIVTLKLNVNIPEVEEKYGIKIERSEMPYSIDILTAHLSSSKDLQNISEANHKALNKVIEDWVISGENDENVGGWTRTYHFETAILLTKESDTKLFFIYHIEDGYVPSGYYVYISPTYTVLVDHEKDTLITGDLRPLSSSFAKYDKDTVRYTEKWGWGQDYERQGFMYNDTPYAGKATLEDMITYLTSYYSDYPTMYQLN